MNNPEQAIEHQTMLAQAEAILAGTTMMLPTFAHLRALADEGVRMRRELEEELRILRECAHAVNTEGHAY